MRAREIRVDVRQNRARTGADEDEAAAHEMIELSGQMGVPFTVITKDDDSEEHILGFDQPRLNAVLGL